jgi:deazaflavin-dependent oxidoreductase (nitroreductase family)
MASAKQRLLKAVGESGLWKPTGRVHAWLYRSTGGRIGHKAGHMTNLLLTTTGRKSGEPRTVTLTYMADGENYVLVASNGGADRHPIWWLNLRKNPRAEVQVGSRTLKVEAVEADVTERARLWPKLKAYNPFYGEYEQITDRQIPVVVLRPSGSGHG